MTKTGFIASFKKQKYIDFKEDKVKYQIVSFMVDEGIEEEEDNNYLILKLDKEIPLNYTIEVVSKPFINFGPYQKYDNEYTWDFTVVPDTLYVFTVNIYDENKVPIARKTTSFKRPSSNNNEDDCNDCVSNFVTLTNGYQSVPMNYGDVKYILTINGVRYEGVDTSTVATSLVAGFSTVYSNNELLYNLISYYQSSSENGEIHLENYTETCVTLSLKAEINYTMEEEPGPIETRILINRLTLCAGNGAPE